MMTKLLFRDKIFIVVLILVIIATGFIRDYLFISINDRIDFLDPFRTTRPHSKATPDFIAGFAIQNLYAGKWILTFTFSMLYFIYTLLMVRLLFRGKNYLKYSVLLFAGLFALSILFYAGGIVLGDKESGYKSARIFMGIAQSPVPLMILIPALFLNYKH